MSTPPDQPLYSGLPMELEELSPDADMPYPLPDGAVVVTTRRFQRLCALKRQGDGVPRGYSLKQTTIPDKRGSGFGRGLSRGLLVVATWLASACATTGRAVEAELERPPHYDSWPVGTLVDELCVTCTRGRIWELASGTSVPDSNGEMDEGARRPEAAAETRLPTWTLVATAQDRASRARAGEVYSVFSAEEERHFDNEFYYKLGTWTPEKDQVRQAESAIVKHIKAYHPVFVAVLDDLTCRVSGGDLGARKVMMFECFLLEEEKRAFDARMSALPRKKRSPRPVFDPAASPLSFRHPEKPFRRPEWPDFVYEKNRDSRKAVRNQLERKYRFDLFFDPERDCVVSDDLSPSIHSGLDDSDYGSWHVMETPIAPTGGHASEIQATEGTGEEGESMEADAGDESMGEGVR